MEEDPRHGCLTPTCSYKQVHLHSHIHTPAQTHHALTVVCGKKQDHARGIKPANGTASFRNSMEKFYLLRLSFIALKSVVRIRNHAVAHWVLGILNCSTKQGHKKLEAQE